MIESRCEHGTCIRPKKTHSRLCAMHDQRKTRGADMDAPEGGLSPWEKLQAAARRFVMAESAGWSERGAATAEEYLKKAALGYRRAYRRQFKGRAA